MMASWMLALFIISSFNTAFCAVSGEISVYWGQYSQREEGSLKEACDSGNYNIVILASLIVYDDGRNPTLNLANHCGTSSNPCSNLAPQIKRCQTNGVKVFLSIGSDDTASSSPPQDDDDVSRSVAEYLLDRFLSGKTGPLGAVSLDGIDIQNVAGSKHVHWDDLVTFLNRSTTDRRILLSASPHCSYPDALLDNAIQTGHVDYVWVQFYNSNPCVYSDGNPRNLLNAWETWTTSLPRMKIFLGLAPNRNMVGYIEAEKLKSEVLPKVKRAYNYGGVMIWDRNSDRSTDYSGQIRASVLKTTT